MEQTVVFIKPDGVQKGLIGEVISRFERAGFKLRALKMVFLKDELLNVWYAHHKDKPFFPDFCRFMQETPVVVMLWEGKSIISLTRDLTGPTDSKKAAKGTIRGDFGGDIQRNIVHVSDSFKAAKKEEKLIFSPEEIFKY